MDTMNSEATNVVETQKPQAEPSETPAMSDAVKKAFKRMGITNPTPPRVETMKLLEEIVEIEDECWNCRAFKALPDCIDPVENYMRNYWQPENSEKIKRLLSEIEGGEDRDYSVLLRLLSNANLAHHYAAIAGAIIRESGIHKPDEELLKLKMACLFQCDVFRNGEEFANLCYVIGVDVSDFNPDMLEELGLWGDEFDEEDEAREEPQLSDSDYDV